MEGEAGHVKSPSLTIDAAAQLVARYSEESAICQALFGLNSWRRRWLSDGGDLADSVELIEQKNSVFDQPKKLETKPAPPCDPWMASPRWQREKLAERLGPLYDKEGTRNGK